MLEKFSVYVHDPRIHHVEIRTPKLSSFSSCKAFEKSPRSFLRLFIWCIISVLHLWAFLLLRWRRSADTPPTSGWRRGSYATVSSFFAINFQQRWLRLSGSRWSRSQRMLNSSFSFSWIYRDAKTEGDVRGDVCMMAAKEEEPELWC